MAEKFFLNADGGSLAFMKEQDFADWDNSVYEADAGSNMAALPAIPFDTATQKIIETSNVRKCIISFRRTDSGATIDFDIYGGIDSTNQVGWYFMDGGDYASIDKDILVGVDVLGVDYVTVLVTAVSAGTLGIDMAIVPFEETA